MSTTGRWGRLLFSSVTALAPACAPVVPGVTEPRPVPPAPPVPASPPQMPPGFSDFHPALTDHPGSPGSSEGSTGTHVTSYGRGTFEWSDHLRWSPPYCPLRTEGACARSR